MNDDGWTRSEIGNLEFAQVVWRVFAEGGSMTTVAEELGRSRQSVSERIRRMKDRGVKMPDFPGTPTPSETAEEINEILATEGIHE